MNTIMIVVLGEAGSGKTVYMSGMYRHLSVDRSDSFVRLRAEESQALTLNRFYRDVINPDREFPPSTEWETQTWVFGCSVSGRNGEFPMPSLHYTDYDGRILAPDHLTPEELREDETIRSFGRRRDEAHVFLIIVDGHKLLRLLDGDRSSEITSWLDDYLPAQLGKLPGGGPGGGPRPVHFVITKWDLLEGRYSLEDARGALTSQRDFAAFLDRRAEYPGSKVRLIPVSVTGPFARLGSDGMEMEKVPGNPVRPLNVDVPFAALLPDILTQAAQEESVNPFIELQQASQTRRARLFRRLRAGEEAVYDPLVSIAQGLVGRRADDFREADRRGRQVRDFLDAIHRSVNDQLVRREQEAAKVLLELERQQQEERAKIEDRRGAVLLAVEGMQRRLAEFELAYPASVLVGERIAP